MAVSGEHRASGAPSRGERVATALDKRLPIGMAGKQFLRKALRRTPGGGYQEARTLPSGEETYRILVRDEPRPRAHGTEVWRWFRRHRVRNALSRWYLGERGELPTTEWQRQRIQLARAGPGEAGDTDES